MGPNGPLEPVLGSEEKQLLKASDNVICFPERFEDLEHLTSWTATGQVFVSDPNECPQRGSKPEVNKSSYKWVTRETHYY